MGKIGDLTINQELILESLGRNQRLSASVYFTGGTALSSVYLHHRQSDDLDLFSSQPLDTQFLGHVINTLAKEIGFTAQSRYIEPNLIFDLDFGQGDIIKVDFAYYPYPKLEQSVQKKAGFVVDSLLDIAANKLLAITQRTEVKDFVDLYFLLQRYTFWELRDGVITKFNRDIEPYVVASDLMVVEGFEYLPRMQKPLSLDTLKSFFKKIAVEISKSATS